MFTPSPLIRSTNSDAVKSCPSPQPPSNAARATASSARPLATRAGWHTRHRAARPSRALVSVGALCDSGRGRPRGVRPRPQAAATRGRRSRGGGEAAELGSGAQLVCREALLDRCVECVPVLLAGELRQLRSLIDRLERVADLLAAVLVLALVGGLLDLGL